MTQPTIRTPSLSLRPFAASDAAAVQRLAGDPAVADTTLSIPHPYLDGVAEEWISGHPAAWQGRRAVTFAIVALDGDLRGAVGLNLEMAHLRGELGYWIGAPFWRRGIATEAVGAMLRFGFEDLGLHRIEATHLTRNPASGRVMQKAGMAYEGMHRGRYLKQGRFEDVDRYAVLRSEWAGPGPDHG